MQSIPLAKHLGSNDKAVRDKAVANLAVFLSQPSNCELPSAEMQKLWKGIFYCYWMSDKPLVQQALSSELAGLLLKIDSNRAAFLFLKGFWESTVREWSGIDRLRMDKYYMIVRKYVYASFLLLIGAEWDQAVVNQYNSILTDRGGPLCVTDTKVPSSLVYHLSDIYLEELDKALEASEPCRHAPLSALLAPFIDILAFTNSNITFKRLCNSMIEPILDALTTTAKEEEHKSDTDERLPKRRRLSSLAPKYLHLCANVSHSFCDQAERPDLVKHGLLQDCFQAGSRPDTRDSNRRKLYAIWKSGVQEDEEHELDAT